MSSAYETDVETVSPCRDIGSSIRGWSGLERLKVSHANRYTIEPFYNRGYTINSSKIQGRNHDIPPRKETKMKFFS